MGVRIELNKPSKELTVSEPESVSSLQNGHYGVMRKGVIHISLEEALYLMDIRNAKCYDEHSNELLFNDLAYLLYSKKLMARYFTYKDWRDRGLMVRGIEEARGNYGKNPLKKYPSSKFTPPEVQHRRAFLSRRYGDNNR